MIPVIFPEKENVSQIFPKQEVFTTKNQLINQSTNQSINQN